MPGMGPPPKDPAQRRRRNATVAMTPLPAAGRQGRPPKFPLGADIVTRAKLQVATERAGEIEEKREAGMASEQQLLAARERVAVLTAVVELQSKAELALWRELWKTPQAVEWDHGSYHREVAQYVRWKVLGESGDMDAAKEARQFADRLGLTPMALLRLRWSIEPATEMAITASAPIERSASAVTDLSSRRARLSG
jgi:hypothetical protein